MDDPCNISINKMWFHGRVLFGTFPPTFIWKFQGLLLQIFMSALAAVMKIRSKEYRLPRIDMNFTRKYVWRQIGNFQSLRDCSTSQPERKSLNYQKYIFLRRNPTLCWPIYGVGILKRQDGRFTSRNLENTRYLSSGTRWNVMMLLEITCKVLGNVEFLCVPCTCNYHLPKLGLEKGIRASWGWKISRF